MNPILIEVTKDFWDHVIAILIPISTLVVTLRIAWQQSKIEKNRLKFEERRHLNDRYDRLWERRFEIYKKILQTRNIQTFIFATLIFERDNNIKLDQLRKAQEQLRDIGENIPTLLPILFDDKVTKTVWNDFIDPAEEICQKIIDYIEQNILSENPGKYLHFILNNKQHLEVELKNFPQSNEDFEINFVEYGSMAYKKAIDAMQPFLKFDYNKKS